MDFYVIKIVSEWRIYREITLKFKSWGHGFLCDLEPGQIVSLNLQLMKIVKQLLSSRRGVMRHQKFMCVRKRVGLPIQRLLKTRADHLLL